MLIKPKQAMNRFNDARFAPYKKKEEKQMEPKGKLSSEIISVESREVSLILTAVNLCDCRIDQYSTKDGQLIAKIIKKEPVPSANDTSNWKETLN